MLSSMSPAIAWRGEETIAHGSPGGSHIPTATLQVLLGMIVGGEPAQVAVARPRIHHQWQPDRIVHEAGALTAAAAGELERRGHQLRRTRQLGEVHVVLRRPDGGTVGAADPRGPGATAGAGGAR
jgi:gamma-glutamyltranspeptidase/glutathione hydrolase